MITFKSPAITDNIWKLYLKPQKEMIKIFYGSEKPEDDIRLHGITEYMTSSIYIDKELTGFTLEKAIRHELMHIYLWETGQQGRSKYTEEEICDITSTSAPIICKTANDIVLELKNNAS